MTEDELAAVSADLENGVEAWCSSRGLTSLGKPAGMEVVPAMITVEADTAAEALDVVRLGLLELYARHPPGTAILRYVEHSVMWTGTQCEMRVLLHVYRAIG